MQLTSSRYADVVVLAAHGRIDHGSADAFRAAVEPWLAECRDDGHRLVFDLTQLDYISSAGLRVLMLASKQARPAGGRIAVCGMNGLIAEIFKISRFDLVFPTHPNLAAALGSLSAAAAQLHARPAGDPAP